MKIFKSYYLAELKTKLIHTILLPKIDAFFKEKSWNYILIGRTALHYYGATTLSDQIELLVEIHEKSFIKEIILNIPNLNSFVEYEGKLSFKYKKIRIIVYITQSTNINQIQFPKFNEIPTNSNTHVALCTLPAFVSLSLIQAKFDRSFIPLSYIELLFEKKELRFDTNLFQFPSIGIEITKDFFYI